MSDTTTAPDIKWGWMLALGISLLLAGMFLLIYPTTGTVAVTVVTGWTFIFGGIMQVVWAFMGRSEGNGFWLPLLLGFLLVITGFLLAFNPLVGAVSLTMLFTIWLLVDGGVSIIGAFVDKGPGRGWMVASGLLSLLLGIMLWNGFPSTALWVVGVFAGISMLMRGTLLIFLSFERRRIGKAA